MARCPLCEHEQVLGDACDVCGRALRGGGHVAVSSPPLDGLESTGHAPVAAPVGEGLIPELEPTGAPAAPDFAGAREAWIESTLQEAVAVVVEPLEVERTSPDGERSPDAALRSCRYCGELVPEGEAFCLRCAMHVEQRASGSTEAAPATVRCRGCGSLCGGERCPACGERLPEPEPG